MFWQGNVQWAGMHRLWCWLAYSVMGKEWVQVRVEGTVEKLPEEESDAYYHSRPRGSQLGAHVSPQSSVLENGRILLEDRNAQLKEVTLALRHSFLIWVESAEVQCRRAEAWGCWITRVHEIGHASALANIYMCEQQPAVEGVHLRRGFFFHGAQLYADESKEIPRPKNWGGFLIRPQAIEFWHGRPSRLHDRLRYQLKDGQWSMDRLAP